MKPLIFSAALMAASGVAIAQDTPPSAAAPATPAIERPSPETDARGIPVVSAPATAPAGANAPLDVPAGATVTVAPNQASVFAPKAAEGEMPACSKTVTDRCKQTYERSR